MSKLEDAPQAFTFDDFVLIPNHSTVQSRKDPDVAIDMPGMQLDIPIISAPMNTVTEEEMLVTMALLGGAGVLHRFMSVERQLEIINSAFCNLSSDIKDPMSKMYVAIGANGDFKERAGILYDSWVKNFCIDVANGHSEYCITAVNEIRELFPDSNIMAGNVCSYQGAYNLAEAGVNSIRLGVGPGSVCTTRQVTGHGLPQLSAIEDCGQLKKESKRYWGDDQFLKAFPNVTLIADGGIRRSGDIVKSLAIGADMVMIGSLLAGTRESPGEIIEEGDRLYKYYSGMASSEARGKWFDRAKSGFVPEGISTKIPYTGKTVGKVIGNLIGGLKTGMSYSGAHDLRELKEVAKWARVTVAGVTEGTPHGQY